MKYYNLLLFILLVVCAGCVTTHVDLTEPSVSYPPTDKVQLLYKKPSRPYKIIATIKGNGSTHRKQSLVFKKIEKKAREIGAQAVIPLNSSLTYVPSLHSHQKPVHSVGSALGRIDSDGGYDFDLKVVAIRFTDTGDKTHQDKQDTAQTN